MSNPTEPFKINLNQNLWGVVISLLALGLAEHFELCTLYYLSVFISIVMILSITITTLFYTIHYCNQKIEKVDGQGKQ